MRIDDFIKLFWDSGSKRKHTGHPKGSSPLSSSTVRVWKLCKKDSPTGFSTYNWSFFFNIPVWKFFNSLQAKQNIHAGQYFLPWFWAILSILCQCFHIPKEITHSKTSLNSRGWARQYPGPWGPLRWQQKHNTCLQGREQSVGAGGAADQEPTLWY